MTTNPNDPASPTKRMDGMTKRERFALEIQGRLMADHDFVLTIRAPDTLEGKAAKEAVKGADALIDALNEGGKS